DRPPPTGLPRPYKHPFPSVLLSSAFARQIASDVPSAAPPQRRRSRGTAEIARRVTDAVSRVARVAQDDITTPITAGVERVAHAISPAWLAVPIMLAAAAVAFVVRFPR